MATAILSVSLFTACSDDDDEVVNKNDEGYIIKNVTFDGKGTKADPLAGGLETTIKGSGFSTSSEIYVRPVSATRADEAPKLTDDVIKLTVKNPTTSSVTITTPFLYGTYELLQKEGTEIYTLGNIYFKEAKKLSKIETVSLNGTDSYQEIKYDNQNRLASISLYNVGDGTVLFSTTTFTYTNDKLTQVKKVRAEENYVDYERNYEHNGNSIIEKSAENVVDRIFTLNDAGQLLEINSEENTTVSEEILDENGKPVLDKDGFPTYKDVPAVRKKTITCTYDKVGNLIKNDSKTYLNGKEEPNMQDALFEITYGSNKSFFTPGSLSTWYYAANYFMELPIVGGIVNEVVSYKSSSMWGREGQFSYDYDDDLYPTKCYALDALGERMEALYYVITYAE